MPRRAEKASPRDLPDNGTTVPVTPRVAEFQALLPFQMDPFQVQAALAIDDGRGVLVAAPTGSGKTVVGEFAVWLGLSTGRKTFYTTPIKALSNQKFHDLVARHGAQNVGLLTGDASINGDAPVVVMTTEVLRNMLYAGSDTLSGLGYVVMDEVHYLADRFRGAVWEEVIIHLPESVCVVSLSATVSNAEEFGEWLGTVRGAVEVVVEEHRPVPLWQHMMVGEELYDLFVEGRDGSSSQVSATQVNPHLLDRLRRVARADTGWRRADAGGPRGRRGSPRSGAGGPAESTKLSRPAMVRRLDREGLLPAIDFIFSRAGCDAAVSQLLGADVRLIPDAEGRAIRRLVEERTASLPAEDQAVLGYWDFAEALSRGYAAHHAGMLPLFREIVEELFTSARIRCVFATETLALGINMPARTVVLEKLVKFNGETHAEVTPAEYTQLTGRAGRRGIDIEGHAVVMFSRGIDPLAVGGLASTRTYPLNSSFKPTSNMAVNLVATVGAERAIHLLESSFAQFQADASVVGLAAAVRRNEEVMAGYVNAMACHLGDFSEYAALREQLGRAEKSASRERAATRREDVGDSLSSLRPGDVILVAARRRRQMAVVVAEAGPTSPPTIVTGDGTLRRLYDTDLDQAATVVGRIPVRRGLNVKSPRVRRDLASTMRATVAPPAPQRRNQARPPVDEAEISRLRAALRSHPCHACHEREDHARWAERYLRLRRDTDELRARVASRTNSVARTFERICRLLVTLGYLTPDSTGVTPQGEVLRRIYAEKDLLVAECLRRGTWRSLDAPSLAAVASAIIHEARREGPAVDPVMPTPEVSEAVAEMRAVWAELTAAEEQARLPMTGEPDAGIVWAVHRWASGQPLVAALRGSEIAAGDFVRRCKQVVDLLGQIAKAAPEEHLRATARRAASDVLRGVVATDRLD